MTEEYLHFIWQLKRLPFNKIKLCNLNKSPVRILNTGWHNSDSGPDFFSGTVIINNLKWSGNIEIHLRSSDWYAHNHHLDNAYDNVVLHVVYEFDKEVYIKGDILPTVELKKLVDINHYANYKNIISNSFKIPCSGQISNHHFSLSQQINISFLHRIERKGLSLFESIKNQRNKNDVFLNAVFKSIGTKTNTLPMQELSKLITYSIVQKEKWMPIRIEAIIFGCAGFLNQKCTDEYFIELKKHWIFLKNKYQLSEMNVETWKFGGVRPHSFPTRLLAQLSAVLLQIDKTRLEDMNAGQIIKMINEIKCFRINTYWENHFKFGKEAKKQMLLFSKLFKQNLLINGLVPYLIALKHLTGNFSFADTAVEIMENLPPENNAVVKNWKELKIHPKNAMETQGLTELYNEFCTFRKCLSCKVGVAILRNKK